MTLLYVLPALLATRAVLDPDIFWHLRTGSWIIEHRALPETDPFSSFGEGRPWAAYSWLFELLVVGLHHELGWLGILLYRSLTWVAISIVLHRFAERFQPSFAIAFVITLVAGIGLLTVAEPRPWLFTILFFVVELDVLFRHERSGDSRLLGWLPPLFVLWSNIHVQFLYGLATVAAFALDALVARDRSRLKPLVLVTLASAAATLVNPYHVGLWQVIFDYARETSTFDLVSELTAMAFRSAPNWAVLALVVAAGFALGRRGERRPSRYLLLAASCYCAFRAKRDCWFLVGIAAAILVETPWTAATTNTRRPARLPIVLTGVVVSAILALVIPARGRINNLLERHIAANFPDAACQAIESKQLPGPLFNLFDWGGYLIWRLPRLKVSMDGRTNLHGDERIRRNLQTYAGWADWAQDPELAGARLVVASSSRNALGSLLRRDPRFELVYEDDVAVVFVRRLTFEKR